MPDNSNKPYSSKYQQISHACGHDGHTVVLLATLEIILKNIEKIEKNNLIEK